MFENILKKPIAKLFKTQDLPIHELNKWLGKNLLAPTDALEHLLFKDFLIFRHVWHKSKTRKRQRFEKFRDAYFRQDIKTNNYPKQIVIQTDSDLGYGVFAKEDIRPNTFLGEYTGILRKYHRSHDRKNPYLVRYPIKYGVFQPLVIDAKDAGNHTRYYNHSHSANAQIISVFCDGIFRMICTSLKWIAKDSQIMIDYGSLYWKEIGKSPQ